MNDGKFDKAISHAWQQAESDLGIRVTAPVVICVEGHDITFEAHIADFGGPLGTLAVGQETCRYRPSLAAMGYFVSQLFPSYREYRREHFAATLDDWRWFGPADKQPAWYTGKPWS